MNDSTDSVGADDPRLTALVAVLEGNGYTNDEHRLTDALVSKLERGWLRVEVEDPFETGLFDSDVTEVVAYLRDRLRGHGPDDHLDPKARALAQMLQDRRALLRW